MELDSKIKGIQYDTWSLYGSKWNNIYLSPAVKTIDIC